MSVEKMKLVKVTGNLNKMNAALTTCFEGGFFHPEHVSEKAGADGYHPFDAVNPYPPILSKLDQIAKDCGVDFAPKQKIDREKMESLKLILNKLPLFHGFFSHFSVEIPRNKLQNLWKLTTSHRQQESQHGQKLPFEICCKMKNTLEMCCCKKPILQISSKRR